MIDRTDEGGQGRMMRVSGGLGPRRAMSIPFPRFRLPPRQDDEDTHEPRCTHQESLSDPSLAQLIVPHNLPYLFLLRYHTCCREYIESIIPARKDELEEEMISKSTSLVFCHQRCCGLIAASKGLSTDTYCALRSSFSLNKAGSSSVR